MCHKMQQNIAKGNKMISINFLILHHTRNNLDVNATKNERFLK